MPDTPSITIVKRFTYKGQPEEYSNTYHFNGPTPGNATEWKALAVGIWNQERTFLMNTVKLAAAYGYVAGNESSVYQLNTDDDLPSQTAGSITAGTQAPGENAIWVRWKTDQRTSKGKPIYLRKYFHGIPMGNGPDVTTSTVVAAAEAYATKMRDGSLNGFVIAAPQGAAGGTTKVNSFLSIRELKRRGKDPS